MAIERLKAYHLSIKFLKISMQLLDQLPKGNAHIRDQLKRASTSIPLNIAEGSGKRTNADNIKILYPLLVAPQWNVCCYL